MTLSIGRVRRGQHIGPMRTWAVPAANSCSKGQESALRLCCYRIVSHFVLTYSLMSIDLVFYRQDNGWFSFARIGTVSRYHLESHLREGYMFCIQGSGKNYLFIGQRQTQTCFELQCVIQSLLTLTPLLKK